MAENPLFDRLVQQLATTDDPAVKAAIIAEITFDQLPPPIATVARRCIILRWFDATILAALLPEEATFGAAEVAAQVAELPFVEKLAWGGLAYHDLTRTGLLVRYGAEQSEMLKEAAALAASAYLSHADPKLAGPEAIFCLIVAGQPVGANQQLDRLIKELWSHEDWNGLLALFAICEQAAILPFVTPQPRTAYHQYATGVALSRLGKPAEAIAAYQQAIALDEKYAAPWAGLGNVYRDRKQYDEAIAAYQQAIALDEKYAYPWNRLGAVYYILKRYDKAIAAHQQAIALDNKFAYPWNGLGNVYSDQKRYDDAIAAYQQAIALDEKFATPWNNLGLVYRQQKQYDDAIAAYQQAIALDEKFAAPWNALGLGYCNLKRYTEAIAAFQQAITLDEKFAWPWNGLGIAYRGLKRYNEAIAALQQAIALDEQFARPWHHLGTVYHNLKQHDEAIIAFQQAIALDERDAWPWNGLGLVYRALKRHEEAEQAIRCSLTLNPQDWTNWYMLADIVRRRGDLQAWQAALDQARPLVNYTDLYNAACFESVAGNVDRGLDLLAQAAAADQLDPAWAREDPDLHWVRHDPRFWALVGESPT